MFRGRYPLPADAQAPGLLPGPVTVSWPEQDLATRTVTLPVPSPGRHPPLTADSVWTAPIAGRPAVVPDWTDRWPKPRRSFLPTALDALPAPIGTPCVLARTDGAVLVLNDLGLSRRVLQVSVECWAHHQPRPGSANPIGRRRAERLRRVLHARSPHLWTQADNGTPTPARSIASTYGTHKYFHTHATAYVTPPPHGSSGLTLYAAWPALGLPAVAVTTSLTRYGTDNGGTTCPPRGQWS